MVADAVYDCPNESIIVPMKLNDFTSFAAAPEVTKYSKTTTSPSFNALPTLSSPNLTLKRISSPSERKNALVVDARLVTVSTLL